ncbi:TIGR02677 family protein [Caldanaerobius fijiensis DSM 17918]|uniref:TIGR02677 family protein n=1 Tax=Caldanaerobius fijiensis DSM 17918 TaxID=1121256 RepID=A0A1M4Y7T5_9THEO|nr:TIGR02677 family protein [Caldanaerobius fijiensis]SHF01729.1 TIGR02677 family protein [Caldanaerobius fijiensis DSM 17918]
MPDKLDISVLKPLNETRYLTAENASRYRLIMRYFYDQYQKFKYWMYKEDVYEYVIQFDIFNDYTLERCEQDLKMLTDWKNLIATQDTSKASTLEEFKNKKFRYQLSPYSIEIERMTIRLESIRGYGGSLEPSLFERIYKNILKVKEMSEEKDLQAVNRWWEDLNSDFENIYHNATDYIASLQSSGADELMRTEAFILYKDKLIEYLRDFIKDLQRFSLAIEGFLKNVDKDMVNVVLNKVIQYQMSIPRLEHELREEDIKQNIIDRWNNISLWFTGRGGEESEAYRLLNISSEIIRRITMYASRIAENRMRMVSRKNDYLKLSRIFANTEDIKKAHLLSAAVFGVFNTRHLWGDMERKTDSITSSVWRESPFVITIKPKTRNYNRSLRTSGIVDRSKSKIQTQLEYLQGKQYEKEVILSYIKDDRICFKDLPIVPPFVRTTLLKWVSRAMGNSQYKGKTEDGRTYRVIIPENGERIILKCTDGNLDMPAMVIEFENKGDNIGRGENLTGKLLDYQG